MRRFATGGGHVTWSMSAMKHRGLVRGRAGAGTGSGPGMERVITGHTTAGIAPPHLPGMNPQVPTLSCSENSFIIKGRSLEGNITRILHEAACLQMNMPGHIYGVARHRSIVVHQGLDQIAVHITLAEQSVVHGRKLLSVTREIASQASERPGLAFEVIQMHGCIHTIEYTLEILEEELRYL